MPKHSPGTETEIVMSVDRDAGVVDLRVFATQHKRAEVVGTATLRMADVSEVVRLLSERLRFEDLLLAGESAATARPDRNESGFPRHAGGASLTH
jgi:hypothetical protein